MLSGLFMHFPSLIYISCGVSIISRHTGFLPLNTNFAWAGAHTHLLPPPPPPCLLSSVEKALLKFYHVTETSFKTSAMLWNSAFLLSVIPDVENWGQNQNKEENTQRHEGERGHSVFLTKLAIWKLFYILFSHWVSVRVFWRAWGRGGVVCVPFHNISKK